MKLLAAVASVKSCMNLAHSSNGISVADDEGALEEVPLFRLETH